MVNNLTAKTKRVRAKLTMVQKVARHEKSVKLSNALATAQDAYQEEARAIAQEHGRSLKWTRKQLHVGKGIFNKRSANPWNVFVRQKMNEYNEGRGVGDRVKLPVFIAEHRAQLTSSYFRLTVADKNRLRDSVETLRQSRIKVARANPKALQKDVNATFNAMQTEWTAIQARTGIEGIYLVVRGDVEQYHEPKLFYTPKIASFIKDVLGMEPKRFALKLESWVVGDFDNTASISQRLSLTKLVSLCRRNIQDGLDIILAMAKPSRKKKVMMNYDNYERKIVETHAVALQNYPLGDVQNPGKIGRREDLMKLLDSLVNATCSWVKLTKDEVAERMNKNHERQARGEQIYKPRKQRTKAPKATDQGAKSAEFVEDEEVEEEEVEGGDPGDIVGVEVGGELSGLQTTN
ncbi:hypothetical protein CY34DRAFT_18499 [Suillus luteus UH-Slu-Lm8-n1]|uniref:Uncharacterized protein n=1 Tax=Suillus luteus UH-Slu-Lm8-n1 TaxID=930992 RepID=A0A0D0A4R3_9AGAM|nr:hypothetical protein CY34DRAFT_18499 [Suillus luteus UH-Slu-Lm8-n1]